MRAEAGLLLWGALTSGLAGAAGLEVKVSKDHLELGVEAAAELEIIGPADLSGVELTVSQGTVGPVRQISAGHFVAAYAAPRQTFPCVAIIAAVATSAGARLQGWARLPLWGRADAALQTTPNAEVSVRIGQKTYGPVRADAQGRGTITVAIPPGVRQGFSGAHALDFDLPKVPVTHLVLEQPSVALDGVHQVGVRLYVVMDNGAPQPRFRPAARVGVGRLGAFTVVEPGVFAAQWTVPPSAPGEVDLSVWSVTEPAEKTSITLQVVAGPPARLTLWAEPSQHVAGDRRRVELIARVVDAGGNPTRGVPEFSSSLGAAGLAQPKGPGTWSAELLLPDHFGGATEVLVSARLPGVPPAQASVSLVPGPATTLRVQPESLSLTGDGVRAAEVTVEVLDPHGNRRPDPLIAKAQGGEVERLPGGSAGYRYRPARTLRAGEGALDFTAGDLLAHVPVALVPAPSRLSAGLRAGFHSNFVNGNALGITAEATAWPGEQLGVGLELGYLFVPHQSEVSTGPLAGTRAVLSFHGAPILASLAWRVRLPGQLRFRATGAGGVTAFSSTLTLKDQQPVTDGAVVPTARVCVGLGYQLHTGEPFLQLEGGVLTSAGGLNLQGALWTVGLSLGYRLDLL